MLIARSCRVLVAPLAILLVITPTIGAAQTEPSVERLRDHPVRSEARYELAEKHYVERRYQEAIALLHDIISGQENQSDVWYKSLYLLGNAYFEAGDYVTSAPYFLRIYQTDPQHGLSPSALKMLALTMHELNDKARGCIAIREWDEVYGSTADGEERAGYEKIRGHLGCSAEPNQPPTASENSSSANNRLATSTVEDNRAPAAGQNSVASQDIATPNNRRGGSQDEICARYGFKSGTTEFAECRFQLDQVAQRASLAQQQYEIEVRRYEQQMEAYRAHQETVEKQREREKWAAIGRLGAGMASSRSPTLMGSLADGFRAANGLPPVSQPTPPSSPAQRNYSIRLPDGRMVFCNYNEHSKSMFCR